MDNKLLTVINFWGGPGTGKSTAAAGLFSAMKIQRYSVELVTEFAKDVIWEKHWSIFGEQDYILSQQNRKLRRLVDKVDYAISDSPLAMSVSYAPEYYPDSFKAFCMDQFNSYENVNIFLNRTFKYDPLGRRQSEQSADDKSKHIKKVMDDYKIQYIELDADEKIIDKTLQIIRNMTILKISSPKITLEK